MEFVLVVHVVLTLFTGGYALSYGMAKSFVLTLVVLPPDMKLVQLI
jgi:hypothetical protein